MARIIAVTGATGAQGGGLARAILADPQGGFTVRAITRNPESDAARALADMGAEVVRADMDDLPSLEKALAGAYGAFLVTNFWEDFSPQKEREQASNLAKAAKSAGVAHVIWSTLEDVRQWVPLDDDRMPTLQGSYKVPHFDAKGEADAEFRELGVPTTFLRASFYWENMIHFGMGVKPGSDGVLELVLPMGERTLPGIAAEDIGRAAYGIFKAGESMIGRTVGVAGDQLTGEEMAAAVSRALGQPVRYVDIDVPAYRALGFPGADDLGNMFQFYQEFDRELAEIRSVEGTRAVNPEVQSFAKWLETNATRMVQPVSA
jgi:uncharacterized protein YbjT (DUF2867 family)